VLFNSSKFRSRYDPMKPDPVKIRIGRHHAQG
jgi:hypothetical protein